VRRRAANQLGKAKPAEAAGPLWDAYKVEKDEVTGSRIASALADLKFGDQSAVPFLLDRLDPRANKLWHADVKLLRQITKQEFGPRNKYVNRKERDAELAKWRQWGESRK
jgi:hypothetical protein